MKLKITTMLIGIFALLLLASPAHATGCLKFTGKSGKIDKYNMLTTQMTFKVHRGTTLKLRSRVYHEGRLEYEDRVRVYASPGDSTIDQYEQLPLSWKNDRIRVELAVSSRCGKVVRNMYFTTPRNPLP